MKAVLLKLIALLLAVIPLNSAKAASPVRGIVLFNEPPATYVVIREFVTIQPTSVVHATITLSDGSKQEIPRAGIVVVIDYPPNRPTATFAKDAATAIQNIQSLRSKYPEYSGKLSKALAAWTTALTVSQQKVTEGANDDRPKTPSRSISLEVEGVKFAEVTLTSFDGSFVGIEHSAGIARISADKLKPAQAAALNQTTTSVRIDVSQIREPVPVTMPPAMAGSAASVPALSGAALTETSEIARLRGAVTRAEATVRKLKEEETTLQARLAASTARTGTPERRQMNDRLIELNDELQQAQFRHERVVGELQNAELESLAKNEAAKVEAFRTATALPLNPSNWDDVVKQCAERLAEQNKIASAVSDASLQKFLKEGNSPESLRLGKIRDAEQDKLEIAKKTLTQAQTLAAEFEREKKRQAAAESARMAAQQDATQEAEALRKFKALPINNEVFVTPPLASNASPSYADTTEFLDVKYGLKIGFGEASRKLVLHDNQDHGRITYAFDPKDISPEILLRTDVNTFGRQTKRILLGCRNSQPKIERFTVRGNAEMVSEIQITVLNEIETEKIAKALSHLVSILGAKKEAF